MTNNTNDKDMSSSMAADRSILRSVFSNNLALTSVTPYVKTMNVSNPKKVASMSEYIKYKNLVAIGRGYK